MSTFRVVFTGGPVSGKTTLLNEFKKIYDKNGHASFVDEVPRELLKDAKLTGTRAVPWDCFHTFELRTLRIQIQKENRCKGLTFVDRSAIDVLAYYEILGGVPPKFMVNLAKRRQYDSVFFFDLLPFEVDAERYETTQEDAEKISNTIMKIYEGLGFDLIQVPVMPVPERVKFVLDMLPEKFSPEIL